jgi:hypothetical protein
MTNSTLARVLKELDDVIGTHVLGTQDEAIERCRVIIENVPLNEWQAVQEPVMRWLANRMAALNAQLDANKAFGIALKILFQSDIGRYEDYRGFIDESVLTPAQKRRLRTAVHEAGHAVIASQSGHYPRLVSIVPCRKTKRNGAMMPLQPELFGQVDGITVLMAGEVAVERFFGRQRTTGCRSDMEAVGGFLVLFHKGHTRLTDDEMQNRLAKHLKFTIEFVDRHRDEIWQVAQTLFKHGRVIFDRETDSFVPVTMRKPRGVDEKSWLPGCARALPAIG